MVAFGVMQCLWTESWGWIRSAQETADLVDPWTRSLPPKYRNVIDFAAGVPTWHVNDDVWIVDRAMCDNASDIPDDVVV